MNDLSQHGEWLSLIDVSGPFLAEPVLDRIFPQGLEQIDALKRKQVRQAYEEWREAIDEADPETDAIHSAWIDLILKQVLELDEDGAEDVLKTFEQLSDGLTILFPEHGVTLRPDYAVVDEQNGDRPLLLVRTYPPEADLDAALKGDRWATSPAERMVELCRASNVRMGLVTNGECWMLVDAPVGAVTTFASWYARLWGQEPTTLQAFVNLLGIRRFFVDPTEQLPALFDESLKLQDEVTDALGEQVRRAVEVLIQRLDRADVDLNRELLKGVQPATLYEAALTVMMRIVFLLSAEERDLLLMGEERYEENYAVSTLRMQLRAESEEILERRWDAWSRLLSIFRAVYGGIEHVTLRLPALGGSLFDPDRFPFLEGRSVDSNWKTDPAKPLPIDNRTVLLLLDAVQLFQGRTLSYRALDVEQIGYVYEGLLERTVVRAKEVTLDLDATKNAKKPWVTLEEIENAADTGVSAVEKLFKERTGSSISRVKNDLAKKVDEAAADKLLTACHGEQALRGRIKPYLHFLRMDRWGYPLVYPKAKFMVTMGADRRETGTHYTPKSLTETIVKETLEPVVYDGPAEGKPREEWVIKTPAELLDLKICDPAMGSGAFLVQVCRWLSERLVEAWGQSEAAGNAVTSEGNVVEKRNGFEPLRTDAEERLLTARRLIAERCLYGVDINPLAVELAKLSVWLITLAKRRPFGFLDHNLKCGDSLLGIHDLDQLLYLDMAPGKGSSKKLFAAKIDAAVERAFELRTELRSSPIRDIRDVEFMASLDERARQELAIPQRIADAFIGEVFAGHAKSETISLSIDAGKAIDDPDANAAALVRRAWKGLSTDLLTGRPTRRPIHWPLEFPEVFVRENGGFDAFVGNPPFLGDTRMRKALGASYRKYITTYISSGKKGKADLVAYFFVRTLGLVRDGGVFGLLATDTLSHGASREVGLEQIISDGGIVYCANTSIKWPGKASTVVHQVHVSKGRWSGKLNLNSRSVEQISADLTSNISWPPKRLKSNLNMIFEGTAPNGEGFLIPADEAKRLLSLTPDYKDILYPYLIARQVNQTADQSTDRWIICFWDWSEERSSQYETAYRHIEQTVKPVRQRKNEAGEFVLRSPIPQTWWQHKERRPALYHAIGRGDLFDRHPDGYQGLAPLSRVCVIARGATKYPSFSLLENTFIYGDSLCVIASENYAVFAALSSDLHAIWAWNYGGRKESRLRYTQESVFETFPFPDGTLEGSDSELTQEGEEFLRARQNYMRKTETCLTDLYNQFHHPDEKDEEVKELRRLQMRINDLVLKRYRFNHVEPEYGFHEVGYLPLGENIRFTFSEKARTALLGHLIVLNKHRYETENRQLGGIRKEDAKNSASSVEPLEGDLFSTSGRKR